MTKELSKGRLADLPYVYPRADYISTKGAGRRSAATSDARTLAETGGWRGDDNRCGGR